MPALRAWIRDLVADGASPSTIRNNANTLTRFFADAKAERWVILAANPMRDDEVRAVMPAVEAPDPGEIEHWTREGFEQPLSRAGLPADRFGLYLVAVLTGMRDGELHGAQWKHAALDAAVPHLRVRQQLLTTREGEPVKLGPPKTKYGKRDLPLHHLAIEWLAWWKARGWAAHVKRERGADDYVFPSPAGAAWRPRGPDILRADLEAAGLSKDFVSPDGERALLDFHATRHTFATWLGAAGVDGELVDRLLGQSPRSVRGRHYQAPSLEALARVVQTLDLAFPIVPRIVPARG